MTAPSIGNFFDMQMQCQVATYIYRNAQVETNSITNNGDIDELGYIKG